MASFYSNIEGSQMALIRLRDWKEAGTENESPLKCRAGRIRMAFCLTVLERRLAVKKYIFLRKRKRECYRSGAKGTKSVSVPGHHSGELKRESAEAKAEGIIREELQRLGWKSADLTRRLKSDSGKLEIAGRVRNETTVSAKRIAHRLLMGSWKSATTKLHIRKKQYARATNVKKL